MQRKFLNTLVNSADNVSLLLYGEIADTDGKEVVEELITLSKQYSKIDVRINSNGGDVFSGMAIYNALKTTKADVTIYVDGVAASIAAIIALCGKPLYMAPYAKLMLHSVTAGAYGNISQIEQTTAVMKQLQSDLAQMIAKRLNTNATEVENRFFADNADHWITATEALQMRLINGIYEVDLSEEPTDKENVYNHINNRLNTVYGKTKISLFASLQELKDKANKWDAYSKTHSTFTNKNSGA